MTEPVKLSRERWTLLTDQMDTDARTKPLVTVTRPLEANGVIFLPAEYVPADARA